MEVRFIFLLPPNVEEILFATPIIRSVVKQVEYAEVISAVQKDLGWVLENNPYVSSQILYDTIPSKSINDFRDIEADYLIDLIGSKMMWFKNRLRVVDFTLPFKTRTKVKEVFHLSEAFKTYSETVFQLLNVFDLQDDGKGIDYFYGHNPKFVKWTVPESFMGKYALLDMPEDYNENIDIAGPLSELISRIERPIVLNGAKEWRKCGEEVMRRTGCTILSTCGDFPDREQVFLRSGAEALINIEPRKELWSMIFDKPHFYFDLTSDSVSWEDGINQIRGCLKNDENSE